MSMFEFEDVLNFSNPEPHIDYSPDLPDDPDKLRWRAWWMKGYDGAVTGIQVHAYPVVKLTPQGAWIDQHAYQWTVEKGSEEWNLSGLKRWVSNTGGAAWAKPTREDALDSLAIRWLKWASRIQNDVEYFIAAGRMLDRLNPGVRVGHLGKPVDARSVIKGFQWDIDNFIKRGEPNEPL